MNIFIYMYIYILQVRVCMSVRERKKPREQNFEREREHRREREDKREQHIKDCCRNIYFYKENTSVRTPSHLRSHNVVPSEALLVLS